MSATFTEWPRPREDGVGVFGVHRTGERIYYEIPKKELNTDFLWVSDWPRCLYSVAGTGLTPEPLQHSRRSLAKARKSYSSVRGAYDS